MQQFRQGTPMRPTLTLLASALLAISLTGCLSSGGGGGDTPPETNPLAVTTTEGDVVGIELNEMRVFRGIPYAAAPVGADRFMPPKAPAERSGPLELDEAFGNMCPQTNISTGAVQGNEDCLFLNVYAPAEGDNLPVMVWIHGGAFVFGNGGGEYDPTRLVEQDVIVVTLNYRLGNLGFLAHPQLGNGDGNFGLMDQQAALRWVKQNIAEFGGNPEMVTLFGESAGGHSVMSHIVSPSAQQQNLFQRAIIQSGSYAQDQLSLPVSQFLGAGVAAAARLAHPELCDEVSDAACLRALSTEQLLALQDSQSLPTAGGSFLPRSIRAGLSTGQIDTNLDIMIGSNQNEGTLFVALDELTNNLDSLDMMGIEEYERRVDEFFEPYSNETPYDVQAIADRYRTLYDGQTGQLSLALSAIWTDFMFACNSSEQADRFAANDMNIWKYWFRDENAPWTLVPPAVPVAPGVFLPLSFPQGATHAGEIPYVLYPESLMRQRYTGLTQDVDTLADSMVTFWTQFAKYGDPNASDGVTAAWPQFSEDRVMQLDAPAVATETLEDFRSYHSCDYWETPPVTQN